MAAKGPPLMAQDIHVNAHQVHEICDKCAHLGTWLDEQMLSERLLVRDILEQRHKDMLRQFRQFSQLGKVACPREDEMQTGGAPATNEGTNFGKSPNLAEHQDVWAGRKRRCSSVFSPPNRGDDGDTTSMGEGGTNGINQKEILDSKKGLQRLVDTNALSEEVEKLEKHLRAHCRHPTSFEMLFKRLASARKLSSLHHRWLPLFEIFMVGVSLLNLCVMALELQYTGFEVGHELSPLLAYDSAERTWPWAEYFFFWSEWIIGVAFTVEIVILVCVMRRHFCTSGWHLFDAAIVAVWVIDTTTNASLNFNPTIFRTMKIFRLVRLVRLIRTMHAFDALHLMLTSVTASLGVLFWSLQLVGLIVLVLALILCQSLKDWISNEANNLEDRVLVFQSWGTFSRACITVFEVALGNWGPPCRLLQEKVSEWFAPVFVLLKCIIGFAVVQVITSVFIQQTFKTTARDEDIMKRERDTTAKHVLNSMEKLFAFIDVSNDGYVSREALEVCIQNKTICAWFGHLGIDVTEASTVFSLIDRGDGIVTHNDFIEGLSKVRGTAKSSESFLILRELKHLNKSVSMLKDKSFPHNLHESGR
eukprot:TRINITY_DN19820_c1_g1_i1.p1 TRINITY_DN19820_c1_g1~~TRINITY_DN19820_c1_g1_i1.p1  ORF type:complete len:589 (-),score=79.56 TRINITY_DN19820_c1_g1_i1:48-1814(-)